MPSQNKIKLYSYYRSSCSYRVRIALNIKKLSYEYCPVHLVANGGAQFSADYQDTNPKMEVPSLDHNGRILSQSMAIILYIDALVPSPPLFPADPFHKSQVIQLCEVINSGIQPIQNLSVMNHLTNTYSLPAEEKANWAFHWINNGFVALEAMLVKTAGKYCCGDTLTAVELFLIPQVYNALRFKVDLDRFPTVQHIYNSTSEMEAFQAAHPANQPDTPK